MSSRAESQTHAGPYRKAGERPGSSGRQPVVTLLRPRPCQARVNPARARKPPRQIESEPVAAAVRRCGSGSGLVAASSTSRLIRAAGSEAERARSHVAAVASARAMLRARESPAVVAESPPDSTGVWCVTTGWPSRCVRSTDRFRAGRAIARMIAAAAIAASAAAAGQRRFRLTDRFSAQALVAGASISARIRSANPARRRDRRPPCSNCPSQHLIPRTHPAASSTADGMLHQRMLALGHVPRHHTGVTDDTTCHSLRVEQLVPHSLKVATSHGHPVSATIYFTAYCLLPTTDSQHCTPRRLRYSASSARAR